MASTTTSPSQRVPVVSTQRARLDGDDAAAGVEAVALAVRRGDWARRAPRAQAGLDDGVLRAVQRALDVAPHGGIAGAHLVGLQERDGARRRVGMPGERLHDGAGGGVTGDGERGHRAEADAGRRRADLLPAAAGAARHVELGARAPAADPHQTEVAHRRAGRARVGLEMVHGEPGLRQLERVPGPDDAAAGHDGPAAVALIRRTIMSRVSPLPARAGRARAAPDGVGGLPGPRRARRWRCRPRTRWRRPPRRPGAVVAVDPAVDLDVERRARPPSTAARTCATFAMTSAMKLWPPKPGKTVMHSTRSTSRRYGRTASNGVSGLSATPARRPRPRIWAMSSSVFADLDVHRAAVRPGVGEVLQVAPGLGHHQVAVEEQRRVAAQRRHHRRPDRDVGDEVPVHHVDVEPVGRRGHLPHLLGQQAEVGRQHRRRDAQRRRRGPGSRPAVVGPLCPRSVAAAQLKRAQHRMRRNP